MATFQTILELALRGGARTKKELEEIGKTGGEAFRKLDDAAKKVPPGLRAVDAAAGSLQGSVQTLTARLGPLGAALNALGPAGVAAGAIGGLGIGFLALAKNAIASADALSDAAKQIGINVEALQELRFAFGQTGIEQATLDRALRKFVKNVGDAGLGTDDLARTLKVLDKSLLDAVTSAGSTEQALDLIFQKLGTTSNEFDRAAIASAAFGKHGVAIAAAFRDGGQALEEARAKAREHIVIQGELIAQADDAQDTFNELSQTIKSQLNAALLEAAPLLANMAGNLISATTAVAGFFESIRSGLAGTDLDDLGQVIDKLNELKRARAEAEQNPSALDRLFGGNASVDLLDRQIAKLRERRTALIDEAKTEEEIARRKREGDDAAAVADKKRRDEQIKAAADQKKRESDAAAAAKKFAAERASALEDIAKLEADAQKAGLEGIALLEVERDQALEKQQERLQEGVINEEDFARVRLAIAKDFQGEKTQLEQKEAEKRAAIVERAAEKAAAAIEKAREKEAEALRAPFVNAVENIQREFGDLFTGIFEDGEDAAQNTADAFKRIFSRLAGELATLLIIRPIIAPILVGLQGDGGRGGLAGGGGGFDLGTIFGLLSKGGSLVRSLDTLTGGIFDLAGLISGPGITLVPSSAALTAGESALLFPSGNVPASFGGAGAAGGIGSAASAGAILFAAVAVLETLGAGFTASQARETAFGFGDIRESIEGSFDPITKALGNIISFVATGTSARNAFAAQQRVLAGEGSAQDIFRTIGLAIVNPLSLLIAVLGKPKTRGTVLRKAFEEFIENKDLGAGFFARDSGTFRRGIGQQGTRARIASGEFTPEQFPEAMREFIRLQAQSIGLTEEQTQQFLGLGVAFRAIIGPKAGSEEQRGLAIVADLLGSINLEGASAAEALEIVGTAIEGLGPPAQVFRQLNAFFTSEENDIAVEDYANAIQGLAAAIFRDVPLGVDAAALALEEFQKDGVVTFEEIATRVRDVSTAAELLIPVFQRLAAAVAADPLSFFEGAAFPVDLTGLSGTVDISLVNPEKIEEFHDAVLEAMRDAVLQGFIQASLQAVLAPTVLEPFTRQSRETLERVSAGEITPQEGAQLIAKFGREAAEALEQLDPAIRQFIIDIGTLAIALPQVGDAATDAADNLETAAKAFDKEIQRLILELTDPDAAAVDRLEETQRNRLESAITLGANLVEVERLNALERADLLEELGADERRQLEQLADDRERIFERQRENAQRALDSIEDLITSLTAGPESPFAPEIVLPEAQARFAELLAKARGGDLAAAEELPEAFQDLAAVARTLFASSPQFFAIFNQALADLESVVGEGIDVFKLSPGDQAIVDEIDAQTQSLLAALAHLGELFGGGTAGGTGPGLFGISEEGQAKLKTQLADLHVGSPAFNILKDLLVFGEAKLEALSPESTLGIFRDQIRQLFPEADTFNEFRAVVQAILDKIEDPTRFQPILGFQRGGSFQVGGVGGPDSQLVSFRATPGEFVSISTRNLEVTLVEVGREIARGNAEARFLLSEIRRDARALRELMLEANGTLQRGLNTPSALSPMVQR